MLTRSTLFLALTLYYSVGYAQTDSATFYYQSGYKAETNHNYTQAIADYYKSVNLYADNNETLLQAQVNNRIGIVLYGLMQYKNAIVYYAKAAALFKQLNDLDREAGSEFNQGLCYYNLGEFMQAGNHYINAKYLYEQTENKEQIAAIYHEIAFIQRAVNEYDSAIYYHQKVINSTNNTARKARAYNQLGKLYLAQADTTNALIIYNKALTIKRQQSDSNAIANTLNNIAAISSSTEAERLYFEALNYLDTANYSPALFNTYKQLSHIYEAMGNTTQALNYSRMYEAVNTSLQEKQQQVETDKRFYEGQLVLRQLQDFEKQKQQKKKENIWLLISSSICFSFITFILYKRRKKRTLHKNLLEIQSYLTT